jgi:hypothetical protein
MVETFTQLLVLLVLITVQLDLIMSETVSVAPPLNIVKWLVNSKLQMLAMQALYVVQETPCLARTFKFMMELTREDAQLVPLVRLVQQIMWLAQLALTRQQLRIQSVAVALLVISAQVPLLTKLNAPQATTARLTLQSQLQLSALFMETFALWLTTALRVRVSRLSAKMDTATL